MSVDNLQLAVQKFEDSIDRFLFSPHQQREGLLKDITGVGVVSNVGVAAVPGNDPVSVMSRVFF